MARHEDLLRKIRGLIDTADSLEISGNTEAANSYREKADTMMAVYAIEQFEVDMHKPKDQREDPEVRDFQFMDMPREFYDDLTYLFNALAKHCRCLVPGKFWYMTQAKVIGYPADLEYLELLFTNLRMHMSLNLTPHAQRSLSYHENLALLKEAGYKWQRIYEELVPLYPDQFKKGEVDIAAKAYEMGAPSVEEFKARRWIEDTYIVVNERYFVRSIPRSVGVRFTKEYTEYCKANNRERIYSDPATYARSFVKGYRFTIQQRLQEMQKASDDATAGKGLVLANRADELREFLYEMFPDLRPHPPDCECDTCHATRCRDLNCTRPACKARRKPVRYKTVQEKKIDAAAMNRGGDVARTADLSGRDRRVGGSTRKEIG